MRRLLVLLLAIGCGGSNDPVDERIDRTGFDLDACRESAPLTVDQLTPGETVGYLELRSTLAASSTGTICDGAIEPAVCMDAYFDVTEPVDAWAETPGGGAPPPTGFLVFTRGDDVGVVGESGLGAFLAPVAAPDAAFLAQVETLGRVDCEAPALREVPGGFEVLTTTRFCNGAITESRIFVGEDGETMVLETKVVAEGSDEPCA